MYRSRRPFHPARLHALLLEDCPGVIRSKGFFWLASRMDDVGGWSQAGPACRTSLAGFWWAAIPREEWPEGSRDVIEGDFEGAYGDRRQELVFIGANMDEPELRRRFDACLLSSRTEGMPIAAYEAFAAGVPVVATAAGGTREAVWHGSTGLVVEPGDSDGLARHALDVLTDPALADRLRTEALALVRRRHTPEAFRDRYRDFYRDIAAAG